jgi:DNA-binding MarR family transcriptional regulator
MIFELIFAGQAQGRMGQACAAVGISPGVMKTLFHLQPGDGVPMRDLADQWGCDASYVTSLTDALEERGLAERRPHPTDRRVKMIVLTDAGVAAKKRAFELLSEPPASFGILSVAEQRQMRDLLRKVAEADTDLASSSLSRPATRAAHLRSGAHPRHGDPAAPGRSRPAGVSVAVRPPGR